MRVAADLSTGPTRDAATEPDPRSATTGGNPYHHEDHSAAELMKEFGVSSAVVKNGISALRSEGLVLGNQGKGVLPDEAARSSGRTACSGAMGSHERVGASGWVAQTRHPR
ncbi:HTH domain-containing protein [Streptomyces canus]|uniref:HTH domain-containing protein n=1 Tax=Streptomyces canus TaxID=58343 RepID=UPI003AF235B3